MTVESKQTTLQEALALLEHAQTIQDADPESARRTARTLRDYLSPRLMSASEAAHLLGITEDVIEDWIGLGRFSSNPLPEDGSWQLRASEVLELRDAVVHAQRLNAEGKRHPQTQFTGADPYAWSA